MKSDPRRVRSDNISSPLLPWLIGSYGHAPPALWPSACVVQRVSGASQSRARRGWARFPPFLPKDPRARPPHSPWRGARPARGIPPGHSTPGRAARRPSRARVLRPVIQRFYRRALGHPKAPCPPFPKAPKNPWPPGPRPLAPMPRALSIASIVVVQQSRSEDNPAATREPAPRSPSNPRQASPATATLPCASWLSPP